MKDIKRKFYDYFDNEVLKELTNYLADTDGNTTLDYVNEHFKIEDLFLANIYDLDRLGVNLKTDWNENWLYVYNAIDNVAEHIIKTVADLIDFVKDMLDDGLEEYDEIKSDIKYGVNSYLRGKAYRNNTEIKLPDTYEQYSKEQSKIAEYLADLVDYDLDYMREQWSTEDIKKYNSGSFENKLNLVIENLYFYKGYSRK